MGTKKHFSFWIQGSGILPGSLAFSENFGEAKDRIEVNVKGDIKPVSCNRNKCCIFLVLFRIRIQRKRWLGSWHMSAFEWHASLFITPTTPFKLCPGTSQSPPQNVIASSGRVCQMCFTLYTFLLPNLKEPYIIQHQCRWF